MAKSIIGIICSKTQRKTIKEVLDQAFESSELEYEVKNPSNLDEKKCEPDISEAIKNIPEIEVDLKNVDYYA